MTGLMQGKRGLIMGLANDRSLAWGIARAVGEQGAELNAALAEGGAAALKGELYTGPYTDELDVVEPQPGEDARPELETRGPQL